MKKMYQQQYQQRYQQHRTIQARKLSHSELAMRAARGMGRSRHKEKTGRVVCLHLLKMLQSGDHDDGATHDFGNQASGNGKAGSDLNARGRQSAEQYSLRL